MGANAEPRQRLEWLWESHADAVRAYAAFRAGRDDAGDVVMETFLIAWRRIEDVPADALPWLLGVARRVISNLDRGTRRRRELEARLREAADVSGRPEPDLPADAVAILRELSTADQEILLATAWYDLGTKAGGQVFGCSSTAFAVRLHRARARARKAAARVTDGTGQGSRQEVP